MSEINLKGKSFLTLLDFTPEEIAYMLDKAAEFKKMKKEGVSHRIHEGKNVALIFEKTRYIFNVKDTLYFSLSFVL